MALSFLRFDREAAAKAVRDGGMRVPDRKDRSWIENNIGVPVYRFADMKSYMEVGAKKVWATFRSCHITASILLTASMKVNGATTGAEITGTDLNALLEQPNPHDSWEEIIYQWVFHMKLTGNAYWLKDQVNLGGRPKYLYPLLPQNIKIYPHRTNKISHYGYKVNGEEIRLETDEVIHFKRPHPNKFLLGMGDLEPSEALYAQRIMRDEMTENFLKKGAMPSGVLSKEDAEEDPDEWAKFKKWWDSEYGGRYNVGKTAFLNGKWAYHKLGLTQQEMESIESEKWSINQIFSNHGVPLSLAGIDKAANRATAIQDEVNFRKYEVVPLLDLLVGRLNGGSETSPSLVRLFNDNWRIGYEIGGLIDVEQAAKEYKPLVDAGAITLNEFRELCGLNRLESTPLLDQHFINSGRIPIELAGFVPDTTGGEEEDDDVEDEEEEMEESEGKTHRH